MNRESMSSVGTISTTNSNSQQQIQFEFEKLQKEKAGLESQLVMYKFKYAEQSSKIIELEDDRDLFKKKYETCADKMRIKEEIIKSLIHERDSLRAPNQVRSRNVHHKIPTGQLSQRGTNICQTQTHSNILRSPERRPNNLDTESVISGEMVNTTMIYTNKLQTDCNTTMTPSGSKTPGGFAKIFKNIFSSDKK